MGLGLSANRQGTLRKNRQDFIFCIASQGYPSVLFDKIVSFLTDDGWLHRAVDIDGEMHIIEELQLFYKPQPIESMVISSALVCIHVCRVNIAYLC